MRYIVVFFALIVAGCASHTNAPENPQVPTPSAESQMERGLKALEKEDYGKAAEIFDTMLVQKPASQFDLLALYNAGVAHEGMGDCKRAAEFFRKAAQSSGGKYRRIEAEALFRLSFAYECMGDDKKSITALLDVKKRASYLPNEIANAELPARLATAYARIGQRVKAMQYFRDAGNGLKSALTSAGTTSKIQQEFAAQTLYAMGQLTNKQRKLTDNPRGFLQSLSMQQPYLLQSAELAIAPASQKAAQDLIFAYENVMKMKPSQNEQVRPFLQLALKDIAEIKRIRLPGKGPLVDQIFAKIEVQESNIRHALMSQPETNPLTPDAERREGLRRQGRMINPPAGKKSKP